MLEGKMMKAFKSFITVLGVIVTLGLFTVAIADDRDRASLNITLKNKTGQTLTLNKDSTIAGEGKEHTDWGWKTPPPETLVPGVPISVGLWHKVKKEKKQTMFVGLKYSLSTDSSSNCYVSLSRVKPKGHYKWEAGDELRTCEIQGKLRVQWELDKETGKKSTVSFHTRSQ